MRRPADKAGEYDVIIIGGGIAGIIFLKYALENGLKAVVLEKEKELGGLWRRLPRWQDIQIRAEDWAINGLPIKGVERDAVLENILSWVDTYELGRAILPDTGVTGTKWLDDTWVVSTKNQELRAKHLIVATGLHNDPFIPEIPATDSRLVSFHSSAFHEPALLAGKRVVVLGGGASAWDLLDLSIKEKASEIHWVYRNTKWMLPTHQPKQARSDLRILAYRQYWKGTIDEISELMDDFLIKKYRHFKLDSIKPPGHFHFDKHVLVGGRPLMIKNFDRLNRYRGTIEQIEGNTILVNGRKFEADILLYATGYRMNLKFLSLPGLSDMQTAGELSARVSHRFQSIDYPNLYFFGPLMLESSTSTPFYLAVLAKSVIGSILGKVKFPTQILSHQVIHWELMKYLAAYDHWNYKPWWKLKYRFLSWWYYKFSKRQISP